MSPASSPRAVVVDASVLIAVAAKEVGSYPVALAQMKRYQQDGWVAYSPSVMISESLYALCRKLETGVLTGAQHARAIRRLRLTLRAILPPPHGDASLTIRAEEVRSGYGCSRSADGLYIALAEQLAQTGPTELVTFDAGMQSQASSMAPGVIVRLLVAP
jgi:predicted nucleic acid-binding protein